MSLLFPLLEILDLDKTTFWYSLTPLAHNTNREGKRAPCDLMKPLLSADHFFNSTECQWLTVVLGLACSRGWRDIEYCKCDSFISCSLAWSNILTRQIHFILTFQLQIYICGWFLNEILRLLKGGVFIHWKRKGWQTVVCFIHLYNQFLVFCISTGSCKWLL